MNAKYADNAYIEKAKLLSDDEMERVLSRMGDKLRKKKFKDKIDCLVAVAIQLELEDEMLVEWRENFAKIKAKHHKKEANNGPQTAPVKTKVESGADASSKLTAQTKKSSAKPSVVAKKDKPSSLGKPEAKAEKKELAVEKAKVTAKPTTKAKISPTKVTKAQKKTSVEP